jgi:hypothetical protein
MSAKAAFAVKVAAAASAVVPKSNLRIAYPLLYIEFSNYKKTVNYIPNKEMYLTVFL